MNRSSHWAQVALLGVALSGCASQPRSPAMSAAESASRAPATLGDATTLAAPARAKADRELATARALEQAGHSAEAAATAETAIEYYRLVALLTREARADERLHRAQADLAKVEEELRLIEQEKQRTEAEIAAIDLQLKVELDREKPGEVEHLTPERLIMRRKAAAQLSSEARSLCIASRLLGAPADSLTEVEKALTQLEAEFLANSTDKSLLPRAAAARASCLSSLTTLRSKASAATPEVSAADTLLRELTDSQHFFAYRDDRGVVVQLNDPGTNQGLTSDVTAALKEVSAIARAHAPAHLLVVVHAGDKGEQALTEKWASLAEAALTADGPLQVRSQLAGTAEPLVDRRVTGSLGQNRRLEVIFLLPTY